MLGKTAGGLFWMSRYIERAENTARLVETGARMALVVRERVASEWEAVITAAGAAPAFAEHHGPSFDGAHAVDFLLRDRSNPSSALATIEAARTNARVVRTAITREVWEAINDFWLEMGEALKRPVSEEGLPDMLDRIRQHGSLVRGAFVGTMLRNEIYDFARIGTMLERADNTARILDVKYHVLLPDPSDVGGTLDAVQWEQLLRAVHVRRAYRMEYGTDYRARSVAEFLILNPRMPRSLRFCARRVADHLSHLDNEYGTASDVAERAARQVRRLDAFTIDDVVELGLHDFLGGVVAEAVSLGNDIARTYRFIE